MKIKPLLLIIVIIALANQAYALGITPSHVDVVFEPGLEKTIQLKVINDNNKKFDALIYPEGELEEYITIENPKISLSKDQDSKIISYKIKLPKEFEKRGTHNANIVIREIPEEAEGKTTVTASIAISSRLNVIVPYEGKYAEIKLFVPKFSLGESSDFSIQVKNLGTEKITEAQAVVEIFNPLDKSIAIVKSEKISINSKQETILTASWIPDTGLGEYYAIATLIYDNLNTKDIKSFTIGELSPDIISISVDNFKLGGIAKFDILVENNWNEELKDVFAETAVKDKKGETYSNFKTSSVDIPSFGKQELNAYWNTSKVIPEAYEFWITLYYLGYKKEKIFNIIVENDKIISSIMGRAVGEHEKMSILESVNTLAILIVGLIIINIVVVVIIVRVLKNFKKTKK